jgi:uncharacterized protein (TIGR03382 family)
MKWMNIAGVFVATMGVSSVAWSGIADFYIADADGQIYSVNGQSLQATEIFQIKSQGLSGINEILFLENNKMLANVTGKLVQYDMTTGVETVILDVNEAADDFSPTWTSGLARTSNDEIFFTARVAGQRGADTDQILGLTYNPFTGSLTESAPLVRDLSLYFDHQQVGENLFLGADFNGGRIKIINTLTGEDEAVYEAAYGAVSFFEDDDIIYTMSKAGNLYTFDSETGESDFYGRITGLQGPPIGASSSTIFRIPSPGSLPLMGLAGIVAVRRRRR